MNMKLKLHDARCGTEYKLDRILQTNDVAEDDFGGRKETREEKRRKRSKGEAGVVGIAARLACFRTPTSKTLETPDFRAGRERAQIATPRV